MVRAPDGEPSDRTFEDGVVDVPRAEDVLGLQELSSADAVQVWQQA